MNKVCLLLKLDNLNHLHNQFTISLKVIIKIKK